jgi:hypothetical protein
MVTAVWLAFSLVYSRGDYRKSLARWRIPLAIVALLPIGLSLAFRQQLIEVAPGDEMQMRFGAMGKPLNVTLLVASVWIVMNLEKTFRSAVGTLRWRIKCVVLGLAVIFGARLYVRCQALLFSAYDLNGPVVESSALLIVWVFLALAYLRTGFAEIDVYLSQAVLRSSVTVIIAGSYLFSVGVLLGIAGLRVLLLSDRLRQRIHGFVGRHFAKAQYDTVRIWTEFSRRLTHVKDVNSQTH